CNSSSNYAKALLAQEAGLQPFLATSPPPLNSHVGSSPLRPPPPKPQTPPTTTISARLRERQGSADTTDLPVRSPPTTVAVLPSSLPEYHRAYMAGRPKATPPGINTSLDTTLLGSPPQDDTTEARRRRVTGSSTNLSAMATKPAMQGMTPI